MNFRIVAPILLENLLPFDFRYILVDKNTRQEYRGELQSGCLDPIHLFDPTVGLALNIQILGTSKKTIFLLLNQSNMTLLDLIQKEAVFVTSTEGFRDYSICFKDPSGNQLDLKIAYKQVLC